MAIRKTIAVVGAAERLGTAMAFLLAAAGYRVLLIAGDHTRLVELDAEIKRTIPGADTEAIDCVKDGCWEADMIMLAVPFEAEQPVAEKIREVATQKIVVHLAAQQNAATGMATAALQQFLPHSKIVTVLMNAAGAEATIISGDHREALQTVETLLKAAGYSTKVAVN